MRKLFFLLLAVLITGCTDTKTIERMGLITTIGYDLAEDGKILTSMVLLQIDPEATQNSTLITGEAYTSKGARIIGDLKSPKKLESGQLRVALYSEEIARQGIINLADTLARDPSISDLTYLAVVEGNVKDLLHQKNKHFSDVSQLIFKELDQNIKGETIPSATLQETIHDYYAEGIDPVLPTLKALNGQIEISGLALFKNDKMVGKISPAQAFYLKLINDRYEAGSLELEISKDGLQAAKGEQTDQLAVVLDTINSSSDLKLLSKEKLEFELKIKLNSRLLEVNQTIDLKNPKTLKLLEDKMQAKIKEEVESLVALAKSKNSDPFGFGEVYRSRVRHSNLTHNKWEEMYKQSTVKVVIDFKIMRTGVVE